MKKMIFFLCLIIMVFALVTCRHEGKTNNVVVSIAKSDKFNKEEINDAINSVKKKFKDFQGCNLTKLWYDEEPSNNIIKGYLCVYITTIPMNV